jgi:hypothetical protein
MYKYKYKYKYGWDNLEVQNTSQQITENCSERAKEGWLNIKVINDTAGVLLYPALEATVSFFDNKTGRQETWSPVTILKATPAAISKIIGCFPPDYRNRYSNMKVVVKAIAGGTRCVHENITLPFCVRVTGSLYTGDCIMCT